MRSPVGPILFFTRSREYRFKYAARLAPKFIYRYDIPCIFLQHCSSRDPALPASEFGLNLFCILTL